MVVPLFACGAGSCTEFGLATEAEALIVLTEMPKSTAHAVATNSIAVRGLHRDVGDPGFN
jgi:hypothetical protein